MMDKILGSLFVGSILILIPDSVLFMSLKAHYLDFYEIKEFYNAFFIDHNIWWLYFLLSGIVGYLFFYSPCGKPCQIGYGIFVAGTLVFFIPDVSRSIGEGMFLQENRILKLESQEINADVYYIGRQFIHFRSHGSEDTIKLHKDEIQEILP